MDIILFIVWALIAFTPDMALAAPLTNAQTYGAAHTDAFRNGYPGMIMAKGSTDNIGYMLEANPTTGGLLVDIVGGSLTLSYDTNYGAVGANTLRTAAEVGNATGAAAFGAGTTTAQVLRVVLPTDQTAIPVTVTGATGGTYADSASYSYAGGNVLTSGWTEVIASTAATIHTLCLTDTSGQVMKIGTGASSSEAIVFLIAQGFSGCIPLTVPAATRVSVRAVTATASTGYLTLSGIQ